MIDPILLSLAFFILGCLAGRSDRLAQRRRPVQTIDRVRLVWSNGRRKA